jgi:hypothetical protein
MSLTKKNVVENLGAQLVRTILKMPKLDNEILVDEKNNFPSEVERFLQSSKYQNAKMTFYFEDDCYWLWHQFDNMVVKVSTISGNRVFVYQEVDFVIQGLVGALRGSQQFTTGLGLETLYHMDKVLRLFSLDDLHALARVVETIQGVTLFQYNEKYFVVGAGIRREIPRRSQTLLLLGVPLEVSLAIDSHVHHTPILNSAVREQVNQFSTKNNISWKELILYPFTFAILADHARFIGLSEGITAGYTALLFASSLTRSEHWIEANKHLLQSKIGSFKEWFLGCTVANCIAWKYSQSRLAIIFCGKTHSTRKS